MKKLSAYWKRSETRDAGPLDRTGWRGPAAWALAGLLLLLAWPLKAQAHRRGGRSLPRPAAALSLPAPPPAPENLAGPLELTPQAYYGRLTALEKAGRVQEAWELGLRLVNLFPRAPQRDAAWLLLAQLARNQGDLPRALELYGLVASLIPGTKEGIRARHEAACLELELQLQTEDPLPALRRFLEHLRALPGGEAAARLRETLSRGWKAVARRVGAVSPPPLKLLEEVLQLWEMQPEGWGPPEAAELLAELLKEHHLYEAAQALLSKVDPAPLKSQETPKKGSWLAPSWLFRRWSEEGSAFGFPVRSEGELTALGGNGWKWPLTLRPTRFGEAPLPGAGPGAWSALPSSQAPGLALNRSFIPYFPTSASAEVQGERPRDPKTKEEFSSTGELLQSPAPDGAAAELALISRDRLGLSHLQGGQLEAAQTAFFGLAQQEDPFWQLLGQVRLTDLELARWQAAASP